uniref:Uncharacterized protein n=1 Tax=Amphimedon queenslandica TaxID=400682 RepID=A0A1X7V024_AMPQE
MQGVNVSLTAAKRMFENVLGESSKELQEAVSPVLPSFYRLLCQKALIPGENVARNVDFDAILEDYKNCIERFDEVYQLREHCLKFLEVLEMLKKPDIAEELRKRWEEKIQKRARIEFRLTKPAPPQQPTPLVPSISPPSLQHNTPLLNDPNRWERNLSTGTLPSWSGQVNSDPKQKIFFKYDMSGSCTTNGHHDESHNESHEETPVMPFPALVSNQTVPHDDDSLSTHSSISTSVMHSRPEQQQTSSNEVNITNNTNNHEEREEEVEGTQQLNAHGINDAYIHSINKTTAVKEDNGLRKREKGAKAKGHEASYDEHMVTTFCKLIENLNQQHFQHVERVLMLLVILFFFAMLCSYFLYH